MIETSELQKVNHSIIKPFRLLPLVKSQTIPKSLGLNLFNSSNMKDILTTEDRTRFNSNCEKKIKELEKSLEFMKDQNQILIKYLFHEIDVLKKKNRDLQFKLVMNDLSIDDGFKPSSLASSWLDH